jgi:hypothetical protein
MLFSVLLIAVLASAHIDSRLILRSHIMFDLRQRLLAEQKA